MQQPGLPTPPYLNIARNGDYSTHGKLQTTPTQLAQSIQLLEERLKTEAVNLIMFVHGGLNAETSALRTHQHLTTHLYPHIPHAYPFPIFWESGLWDVTGYLLAATPFGEAFLKAAGEAEYPVVISEAVERRTREACSEAAQQARMVEQLLRWSGLAALGRRFWDTMKFQTKNSFSGSLSSFDGRSEMPGRALLRRLVALKLAHGERLRIQLIGHSAGAILLGHLFEAAATLRREARVQGRAFPEQLVEHLVLLAPAITYVDFENHLWRNQDLFSDLYVFGLKKAYENDSRELLHQIYPATLLYLVSNVFEELPHASILGLQRDACPAARADFRAARDYLAKSTVVWAPTEPGQFPASRATSHGGFVRDPMTLASLSSILR